MKDGGIALTVGVSRCLFIKVLQEYRECRKSVATVVKLPAKERQSQCRMYRISNPKLMGSLLRFVGSLKSIPFGV